MFEIYCWILSLFSVGCGFLFAAWKYDNMDVDRAAIPLANAKYSARMNLTNAISYIAFSMLCIFCIFAYPAMLPLALQITKEWWIVEVFIFWNLRTLFLLAFGMRKIRINI